MGLLAAVEEVNEQRACDLRERLPLEEIGDEGIHRDGLAVFVRHNTL